MSSDSRLTAGAILIQIDAALLNGTDPRIWPPDLSRAQAVARLVQEVVDLEAGVAAGKRAAQCCKEVTSTLVDVVQVLDDRKAPDAPEAIGVPRRVEALCDRLAEWMQLAQDMGEFISRACPDAGAWLDDEGLAARLDALEEK